MDKALYVAMNSGTQLMDALAVHSNNLANASTTGFVSDFAQARSQSIVTGDGHSTRAFVQTEKPSSDFSRGKLMQTGRDLDVAVDGTGWSAVQAPDGSAAYTRMGSLKVSPLGQLMTANNLPVIGEGGPIAMPPATKLQVGSDGTITIQPKGQGAAALATVDRIKLVKPDERELTKGLDGLMRRKDGEEQDPSLEVGLKSGFLESSNVNPVNELTNIMSLSRQFEMSMKLMKKAEEHSQASARLLQMN